MSNTSRSPSISESSESEHMALTKILRERASFSILNERDRYVGSPKPLISVLPPELLALAFSYVYKKSDLLSILLSCKYWSTIVIDTIWFRPGINSRRVLDKVINTMALSSDKTTWDYRKFIRRLNLSLVPSLVDDCILSYFLGSVNLERITLVSCSRIHQETICGLLQGCNKLQSIDLTGVNNITDDIYNQLATHCKRLQGLYAPGSHNVSKDAVLNLINSCPQLKRIKLCDCNEITDDVIHQLVIKCPYLVELDLHGCEQVTNEALCDMFLHLEFLKEFKISKNQNIDWRCFESSSGSIISLDKLRILDFTQCQNITDRTVEKFISLAPKLRNVVLSKCSSITDKSLKAIATLGKNLHYVHLGHCSNITDEGAINLLKSCYRLQYIDLACCNQLTNATVMELATLPKLRRIGLVKCSNITDQGILALAANRQPDDCLERIHLSYCIHLTIFPIHKLLKACPKLTHISLTGIAQFLRPDITRFCREPPVEFNQHQKSIFCVFSGEGVKQLRVHLSQLVESTGVTEREALELVQIIRSIIDVVQNPPTYEFLQGSPNRSRFVNFSRQAREFLTDYQQVTEEVSEDQISLFLRCVFGGIPTSHTPIIQRFFQLMHHRPNRERQRIHQQHLRELQAQNQFLDTLNTNSEAMEVFTEVLRRDPAFLQLPLAEQIQVIDQFLPTFQRDQSNPLPLTASRIVQERSLQRTVGENGFFTPESIINSIHDMSSSPGGVLLGLRAMAAQQNVTLDRFAPPGFDHTVFNELVEKCTLPDGRIHQEELSRLVQQTTLLLKIAESLNRGLGVTQPQNLTIPLDHPAYRVNLERSDSQNLALPQNRSLQSVPIEAELFNTAVNQDQDGDERMD